MDKSTYTPKDYEEPTLNLFSSYCLMEFANDAFAELKEDPRRATRKRCVLNAEQDGCDSQAWVIRGTRRAIIFRKGIGRDGGLMLEWVDPTLLVEALTDSSRHSRR